MGRRTWRAGQLLLLAAWLCSLATASAQEANSTDGPHSFTIEVVMPPKASEAETYLCTSVDLPNKSLKITGVEPLSKEELVHHMLLFGCESKTSQGPVWDCKGHSVCPGGGSQQILYGWAKGAPAMHLPDGVGYKVGQGTKIDNLVMQIHYGVERPEDDTTSGMVLNLTEAHVPFSAGMLMYASAFTIPAKAPEYLVPNKCCYAGFEPAHAFAFRVHTHGLGRSVYLDKVTPDEVRHRQVEHSPQLPQGFTPVERLTFWPGEHLEATCNFDARERDSDTNAGATHHDEMCNLYMIMWSQLPIFLKCFNGYPSNDRHGVGGLPNEAALVAESPRHWQPPPSPHMGQVAGVAKGHNGTIWVFHRGDRVWDEHSFTGDQAQHVTHKDPIPGPTVLQLDQDTGEVLAKWGQKTFFMPHMITVDRWGFIWLTDVGLQQAFKYDASGKLLLTLGKRLEPGTEGGSFCKPTQVAVSNNGGRVFVSDGYCNDRVAEFTPEGEHVGDYRLAGNARMSVPHAVVLDECSNALIVADRESSKVQRFDANTREHTGTWDLGQAGLVFGLAMGPYGTLLALCWDRGGSLGGASAVVLLHSDPNQGVEAAWKLEGVQVPHDLAVVAAPVRLAGSERPLAVLVSETRMADSKLHKFILLPKGAALPADVPGETHLPAHVQWKAVFAAASPHTLPSNLTHLPLISHSTAHINHSSKPEHGHSQGSEHGHGAFSHASRTQRLLPETGLGGAARQVALAGGALGVLMAFTAVLKWRNQGPRIRDVPLAQ